MKIFTLFHSVYFRLAKNGLFLYDTERENKLVIPKSLSLGLSSIEEGFLEVTNFNKDIINQLFEQDFGYYVDCECKPIVLNSLNFTSSKSKIRDFGINIDGGNALSYVSKISIHIDPINDKTINPLILKSLDFPEYSVNSSDLTQCFNLLSSVHFPNLQEVEIVSDITERAIDFANKLITLGYFVTFRTIIFNESQIPILHNIINKTKVYFKVYINILFHSLIKGFNQNNTYIIFWSDDLEHIIKNDDKTIIPVLYSPQQQKELCDQVLLSMDDILAIKRSHYELKYNSLFNSSFMGNLKFAFGKVIVGNQILCNQDEFPAAFSKSLFENNHPWFASRNKKTGCCDCIFSDLCPSVSLIEMMNVIERPCNKIMQ